MQNLHNPHLWPVNLTESSELLEITVNHPNSAQSTLPLGEYCKIRAFCTQQNRKVMNYYAHILLHIIICMHIFLHTCRLVLDAYNFTISTVFYIGFYVFYTKLYNHFRTIVFELIDPNKIQKQNYKCCRYTRLYPVQWPTNCTTF